LGFSPVENFTFHYGISEGRTSRGGKARESEKGIERPRGEFYQKKKKKCG
jgi:hypothetical protein